MWAEKNLEFQKQRIVFFINLDVLVRISRFPDAWAWAMQFFLCANWALFKLFPGLKYDLHTTWTLPCRKHWPLWNFLISESLISQRNQWSVSDLPEISAIIKTYHFVATLRNNARCIVYNHSTQSNACSHQTQGVKWRRDAIAVCGSNLMFCCGIFPASILVLLNKKESLNIIKRANDHKNKFQIIFWPQVQTRNVWKHIAWPDGLYGLLYWWKAPQGGYEI